MAMDKIFHIGQWVATEDGYGQIIYIRKIFSESFSKDNSDNGTFLRMIYLCKIFCNFKGKIKKSHQLRSYTRVDSLTPKKITFVDEIKEANNDKYLNYIYYDDKVNLKKQIFLTYEIDKSNVKSIEEKINSINSEIKPSFTFKEFIKESKNQNLPINLKNFKKYGETFNRSNVIDLRFDSELYKVKGNNSIFTNVILINFD
jgi:hypothetical protein